MLNFNKSRPSYAIHSNSKHHTSTINKSDNTKSKQEFNFVQNNYSVKIVNSQKQCLKANTLVKQMYASRGYLTKNSTVVPCRTDQVTFAAFMDEIIIGTITLKLDSDSMLLADELYRQELSSFRTKGRKICELSKFSILPGHGSKELFAILFHLAYIYAYVIHNVKDAFIEINPRHNSFYKRMLGFHQIGQLHICKRVDAPAALLHLDLDYMNKQINSLAGSDKHSSKSIYPYFLSQHEEKKLTYKLQKVLPDQNTLNFSGICRTYAVR